MNIANFCKRGVRIQSILCLLAVWCALSATRIIAEQNAALPADQVDLDHVDLKKGLVLHFSCDTPAINGAMKDESGTGNDGHVVGAKWVAEGKGHGAYSFNPANKTDAIVVPANPSLDIEHITESAWIKTSVKDIWWRRIIDKNWQEAYDLTMGGVPLNGSGYFLGKIGMELGERNVFSSRSVADGKWHHVVSTFDGSEMVIYVDGQEQKRKTVPHMKIGISKSVLRIGNGDLNSRRRDGSLEILAFDGEIHDVRIYNRALSPDEVAALNYLTMP